VLMIINAGSKQQEERLLRPLLSHILNILNILSILNIYTHIKHIHRTAPSFKLCLHTQLYFATTKGLYSECSVIEEEQDMVEGGGDRPSGDCLYAMVLLLCACVCLCDFVCHVDHTHLTLCVLVCSLRIVSLLCRAWRLWLSVYQRILINVVTWCVLAWASLYGHHCVDVIAWASLLHPCMELSKQPFGVNAQIESTW